MGGQYRLVLTYIQVADGRRGGHRYSLDCVAELRGREPSRHMLKILSGLRLLFRDHVCTAVRIYHTDHTSSNTSIK
jgi:hypothetical protein